MLQNQQFFRQQLDGDILIIFIIIDKLCLNSYFCGALVPYLILLPDCIYSDCPYSALVDISMLGVVVQGCHVHQIQLQNPSPNLQAQ